MYQKYSVAPFTSTLVKQRKAGESSRKANPIRDDMLIPQEPDENVLSCTTGRR